jgi:hypothetical protein
VFIMAHNLNRGCLPSWISGSVAGVRAGGAHDSGAVAKPSPQLAYRKGEGLERHDGLLARCSESRRHAPQPQGQVGGGDSGRDAWPSRPGEPQHWWEPPRVVANTEFIGRRGRSDGDARGLCGEIQTARPCDSGAELAVGDAEHRKTEPKVGGGIDGAPDWVGYGELCVSSDNRTDELRMLGNGVVPATAARAFLTLMEELNNHHEQNRATIR